MPKSPKEPIIKELFFNIGEDFTNHLNLPNNERIIFSGIFGIGKTTFLKHHFSQEAIKEKYNVFHLFPVNYSILNNEDIFRFLKYDILYEMMEQNMTITKKNTAFIKSEPEFIKQNLYQIISALLLLIPKVGKQYHQLSKEIEKLYRQFLEYNGVKTPEKLALADLFNSATKRDGELHEFNIITQIIYNKIAELKANGKENILILDDLDRIDPNHIFRILNVFAAHFDTQRKESNKFGFDKIILVCDIKNIQNIFRHKYGIGTDFNGYIDKFFSKCTYNFDNSKNISLIIRMFLNCDKLYSNNDKLQKSLQNNIQLENIAVPIINDLINCHQLNLRNLVKNKDESIFINPKSISSKNNSNVPSGNIPFLFLVDILLFYFVDIDAIIDAFHVCDNMNNTIFNPQIEDSNYAYGLVLHCIAFLSGSSSIKVSDKRKTFRLKDLPIELKTEQDPNYDTVFPFLIKYDQKSFSAISNMGTLPFYKYIIEALTLVKGSNYKK